MTRMRRLICRIAGHRWSAPYGIEGREFCWRCDERRDFEMSPSDINDHIRRVAFAQLKAGNGAARAAAQERGYKLHPRLAGDGGTVI